ncbi:MAG TPA: thioesterase family protein [Alphaproteobacteria bacterium]|nr:thioesterase family protein [Alphaproteobacteria bacterium]
MKPTLQPGLMHTRTVIIDKPRTIDFMGEDLRVYATPEMVRDMEQTSRLLLLPHLDEGEDSVGMRVEIDHLGPALLGQSIEVAAKVVALEGRKATFEVEARDESGAIGRGRHIRFVVIKEKSRERLKAKRAALEAASRPRSSGAPKIVPA